MMPTLPAWVPDDRAIGASIVLMLTLAIALLAGLGARGNLPTLRPAAHRAASTTITAPTTVAQEAAPAATEAAPTPPAELAFAQGQSDEPTAEPTIPAPVVETPTPAPTVDGALLPAYRVITYYGHPHDANMGIIGEYPKEEIASQLATLAADYEAADPSRPVKTAFELIATVAQRDPGPDGTYILDTDLPTLQEYVDYAAQHDMLVFLDLQIGRGTVQDEIEKVRPLLEQPHVHLALDPEFAIAPGETPGEHIGSLDASSIQYAQNYLAKLSADLGIPPKILMVHQFREDMIQNEDALAPVPGVQLVIDSDGYGEPELKTSVYDILVRDRPIEFAGIKLFYKQDHPLLTPQEILALVPSPDVIVYQ